jgi:propionate CoA-transferase
VDYIVIATDKRASWQTEVQYFEPSFSGDVRLPLGSIPALPLGAEKIIVRRAAMELVPDAVVNLGIGIAASVASVAAEEGVSAAITLPPESGVIGGVPAGGQDFGQAYNPEAIIEHNGMFDYYDGGGLDLAYLGLAQADAEGNVNVSKFGRPMGPGGFINITQNPGSWCLPGHSPQGGSRPRSKTAGSASSKRAGTKSSRKPSNRSRSAGNTRGRRDAMSGT